MKSSKTLSTICSATIALFLFAGAAPATAHSQDFGPERSLDTRLREYEPMTEIVWQGPVTGTAGQKVAQQLILSDGEEISIVVDWHTGLIEIDRSSMGRTTIPMDELEAAVNQQNTRIGESSPQRSPEDINWGSMCQWLAGLTGLGHAAIWSIVSPWIGIPYGVFWLWVGMQCK